MNGWYEGASTAARDKMERYRREARQTRLARPAHPGRRPGRLRRGAAEALRRLADALAPQAGDALA